MMAIIWKKLAVSLTVIKLRSKITINTQHDKLREMWLI